MKRQLSRFLRFSSVPAVLLLATAAMAEDPDIIRVEEDWVAYITNPDSGFGAPQITNVISPRPTTEGAFGIIELNHGSQPNFRSGGYQVQSWLGEFRNDYAFSEQTVALSRAYDKLVYTVCMELSGEKISFTLINGKSRTWGRFARDGITATAIAPAYGVSLSDYSPQFSVDNTTINVGAHRVALMYQSETRYYSADGLERTDTTARVLHRFREVVQFVSLEEYEANADYFNIEITE